MTDSTSSLRTIFCRNPSAVEENGRRSLLAGFTLIELLVVISIIGLLSSVVLASLSGARESAKNAAIKSEMQQMQTQAELYYQNNGDYYSSTTEGIADNEMGNCFLETGGPTEGTVMADEGGLKELAISINDKSDAADARVYCAVGGEDVPDSWAFAAPLFSPQATTTGWCVDSSGKVLPVSFSFSSDVNDRFKLGGETQEAMCP